MKKILFLWCHIFMTFCCLDAMESNYISPASSPSPKSQKNNIDRKRKRKSEKQRRNKRNKGSNMIIILNGITSSGKTSLMEAVKDEYGSLQWVYLSRDEKISNDHIAYLTKFQKRFVQWGWEKRKKIVRLDCKENILLLKNDENCISNREFNRIYEEKLGNHGYERMIKRFLDEVINYYECGYNVVVDTAFLNTKEFEEWILRLAELIDKKNYKAYFVKVDCSLVEAKRRTKECRSDRKMSIDGCSLSILDEQYDGIHRYKTTFKNFRKRYDLTINTEKYKSVDLPLTTFYRERARWMVDTLCGLKPSAIEKNYNLIRTKLLNERFQKLEEYLFSESIENIELMEEEISSSIKDRDYRSYYKPIFYNK